MIIFPFIALLALCGTSYFEDLNKQSTVGGGRYEHGWSSYLAWVGVLTLMIVNLPVGILCYMCYVEGERGSRSPMQQPLHTYNNNYSPTAPPVENPYEVIFEKRNCVDSVD